MRLVNAMLRDVVFQSTHHLFLDDSDEPWLAHEGTAFVLTSRRMRHILASFHHIRSLRLMGLQLVYSQLVLGRDGRASSPRYICSILQEAECAQHLECLELLNVSDYDHSISDEWGAGSRPSYSLHTDIQLEQLQKLTITLGYVENREYSLVHSLLRSSNQITNLTLTGWYGLKDYDLEEAVLKPLGNTLVHLNLSESGVETPTIQSTILETLILQRCSHLSSLGSDSFCPSLNVLDLSDCPSFKSKGIFGDRVSGLVDIYPRLRFLKIKHCSGLRFVSIMKTCTADAMICNNKDEMRKAPSNPQARLSETLGYLEDIDLSMCVHLCSLSIDCPSLRTINTSKCMHLKMLSLSSSTLQMLDLSKLPLEVMSLRCPKLNHLNIAYCRELDSKRSVVKCSALEYVNIEGATYITLDFFQDSSRKCKLEVHN